MGGVKCTWADAREREMDDWEDEYFETHGKEPSGRESRCFRDNRLVERLGVLASEAVTEENDQPTLLVFRGAFHRRTLGSILRRHHVDFGTSTFSPGYRMRVVRLFVDTVLRGKDCTETEKALWVARQRSH